MKTKKYRKFKKNQKKSRNKIFLFPLLYGFYHVVIYIENIEKTCLSFLLILHKSYITHINYISIV